ncbi:PREDICTED: grainyhead-like protein 1 homolog, partial [Galeopterus variegatus]|uniref:Grainyhead-like protein 1 homolog n=1 Tax=Galeopterus variegatus TaxID=482537 RepID=A0ABM0SC91_GALVR
MALPHLMCPDCYIIEATGQTQNLMQKYSPIYQQYQPAPEEKVWDLETRYNRGHRPNPESHAEIVTYLSAVPTSTRREGSRRGSCKRPVLVLQNEALYPQRRSYTSEDEAWKSFLENPLTAATKAMMSINGDEDSAAALGLLYDYYKVPRERRSSTAKPDAEHPEPDHSKRNSIPVVTEQPLVSAGESRVQVLKNVPFNIVLPHGNQLGIDKRGHLTAPDTTVTVSIATLPTHSIKTETQPHGFAVGIPPAVYHPEPTERVVVFDRNLNTDQFSSAAQPLNAQRRTPDSTFSETFKEGVQEVFFPSDLSLRMPGMNSEDYVFDSVSGNNFEYTLEASKSLRQKPGDSTMTYLNKGQFYPVTLKEVSSSEGIHHPISKVRVTDYKESFNTISNIEEIAYNAISFTWDINDEAK